jgi:integrase/recombinase XerD
VNIHPKAQREKDPDAFSPEEVGALMEQARKASKKGEKDALAILLAYSLGLRRSEVCKLAPDDVDWEGQRVLIRESKGGKSRWVEGNEIAMDTLERLKPWNNGTVLGGVDPQWFTMIVHRAAVRAGLPPGRRNAHMLRAAFATNLMDSGADVTIVGKLLGHSDLVTTMRYRAVRQKNRKEAVSLLPAPPVR